MNIKSALGITTISKYDELNDPLLIRETLLGSSLRQRNTQQTLNGTADYEEVIKYQEERQNKIAEEVLEFTKTLKEQSEVANRIIKKDTKVGIWIFLPYII